MQNFKELPTGDIDTLKAALAKQPVSVCVDGSSWWLYSGGVISKCGKELNHAVVLVGYNSTNWIVKNSWGTLHGEKGYVRLAPGDTCGVSQNSVIPVL